MAELKFIVSMDSTAFKDGAKDVMAQVRQMSNEVNKEGKEVQKSMDGMTGSVTGSVSKSLAKIGAAFGGIVALKQFIGKIVEVRGEFQKTGVALETMLGSKAKADELMQEVKQIAASSPLEFGDITKATQQMLAFNIEAEKVPQFIKAIGDVSMGEKDRFNSLSLAFAQMSASGKLMGQDLLQMINAGFNPLATMAEKTGKSIGQLKDEMSKGAISAEMVQQAFIDATSAGGKFYGMSDNAAKTVSGQISMMQDAISNAFNELGTKSEGLILNSIEGITKLVENYEQVIRVIGAVVTSLGIYKGAVVLANAVDTVRKGILEGLTIRQQILNATMLANPIVAWGAALAAVVTTIYMVATAESTYDKTLRSANEALDEQKKKLEEREQRIDGLIRTIRDDTKLESQRIRAYEQLKMLAPELTKEYDRQALATMDAEKAQRLLNEAQEDNEYQLIQDEIKKTEARILELRTLMEEHPETATIPRKQDLEAQYQYLRELEAQLKSYVDARNQAAEDAKPIKIRIEEAEENVKNKKEIVDFWDGVGKKIEELSHPSMVMTFESSKANLDAYIKEVEDMMDKLQQDIDKNPTDAHLRLKQEEGAKVLDILRQMRQSWLASGNTEIPVTLQLRLSGALQWALNAFNVAGDWLKGLTEKKNTASTSGSTTKTPKAGKGGSGKDDKLQREKDVQKYKELLAEQEREEARAAMDMELNKAQAEIDALEEGEEKVRRQLKLSFERRAEEINREYEDLKQQKIEKAREVWEANPDNKNKLFDAASVDTSYTAKELEYFNELRRANMAEYLRGINKFADEEWQALNEYYKQYGTYNEKRLAITKEYNDKIEKATTEGERKMLEKQREEALSQLDFTKLQQDMDWSVIFGDLNRAAEGELKQVRTQLQLLKKDANYYKRNPDQIKVIEEAINRINAELATRGGLFGGLVDSFREYEAALQAVIAAEEQLKQAVTEEEKERAQLALTTAKQNLKEAEKTKEDEVDIAIGRTKKLMSALTELGSEGEMSLAQLGSLIGNVSEAFGESAGKIGGIIGSILALLDSIGNRDIDEWAKDTANKLFNAIGQALNSKYSLLHYIAGDLMGASNNLAEDIPKLTNANKDLEAAIKANTKALEEASVADAAESYKKAVELMAEREKNMRAIMQEAGSTYSQGVFGIGGKRSAFAHIDEAMTSVDWNRISKIVGKQVSSAGGFFALSSEDMAKISEQASDLYTKIKNAGEDGFSGVAEYMDEYIQYFEEFTELQGKYLEKLTDVSLDSMVSDFKSALEDMESDSADFAKKFEEYMRKAVINALVTNNIKPLIEKWYESFARAFESGGLDKAEKEALEREWDAITEQGLKMRDELAKQFAWDVGAQGEGSGAYRAAQSFSQEQGDELNGRLASIQIGQERNNVSLLAAVTSLQNLSVVVTANQTTLSEMRNLMLIGNGHLEDIARYTRLTSQNSELLQTIATKVNTL